MTPKLLPALGMVASLATLVVACDGGLLDRRIAAETNRDLVCRAADAAPELSLERVLASEPGAAVIRTGGMVSMAPYGDSGLLFMTAGESGALWSVDSMGQVEKLNTPDSLWTDFPGLFKVFTTRSGAIVVWESATASAIFLSGDGSMESINQVARPLSTTSELRMGPTGDLYVELGSRSGPGRIIRHPWPLGSSAPDTLDLPETSEGRKFATASQGNMTVNNRVPFHPEPSWSPIEGGRIAWISGANHEVREIGVGTDQLLICDPDRPRAPVNTEEREENEAVIVWMNRYTDTSWTYVGPRVPEVHPAIVAIASDWDGTIQLTVPVESRKLTESESWSMYPADPDATWRTFEERWEIQLYSREGKPLGTFPAPPQADPRTWAVSGETVWAVRSQPWSGLLELVRYRIVQSAESVVGRSGEPDGASDRSR